MAECLGAMRIARAAAYGVDCVRLVAPLAAEARDAAARAFFNAWCAHAGVPASAAASTALVCVPWDACATAWKDVALYAPAVAARVGRDYVVWIVHEAARDGAFGRLLVAGGASGHVPRSGPRKGDTRVLRVKPVYWNDRPADKGVCQEYAPLVPSAPREGPGKPGPAKRAREPVEPVEAVEATVEDAVAAAVEKGDSPADAAEVAALKRRVAELGESLREARQEAAESRHREAGLERDLQVHLGNALDHLVTVDDLMAVERAQREGLRNVRAKRLRMLADAEAKKQLAGSAAGAALP